MQIEVGNIVAGLVYKDIKHVNLSVHPPDGRVTISAPRRMEVDAIRLFSLSKLAWIKAQQRELKEQERESPREFLNGESHYVWGKRYLLKLETDTSGPDVELDGPRLRLKTRPDWSAQRRAEALAKWYRAQVRQQLQTLLPRWERALQVTANQVFVRHMKTRWGSCNPASGNVRLNTELARKPKECLEYILVHELVHMIEPRHGEGFVKHMDKALPEWRSVRDRLNQLPVKHEDWAY
jgi:predicted metal-dependent hydrolase